jgi:hypothetical protein
MARTDRQLIDAACPGLVLAIEALGGAVGPISRDLYAADCRCMKLRNVDANNEPTEIQVALEAQLAEVDVLLRIVVRMKKASNGRWLPSGKYQAFHCGPKGKGDLEDKVYFRIDIDNWNGHHFHLRGQPDDYGTEHIPIGESAPSLAAIDPLGFVELVKKMIETKTVPVKRVKK